MPLFDAYFYDCDGAEVDFASIDTDLSFDAIERAKLKASAMTNRPSKIKITYKGQTVSEFDIRD